MATVMNVFISAARWVHCITRTVAENEIEDVTQPDDVYQRIEPTGRWRLRIWGIPLPWVRR